MTNNRVRLAQSGEGLRLGEIARETLTGSLAAALEKPLPADLLQNFDPVALGESWERAIEEGSGAGRILVALSEDVIVGFVAATAPSPLPGGDTPLNQRPADVELVALEVPTQFGRHGHGSRLLAAITDLLAQMGATRVQIWVVAGDEAKTRFLASAGFAPSGLRRKLPVGEDTVIEQLWFTDLSNS